MSNGMNKDKRIILIILALIAVAFLAALCSLIVTGVSLERQIRRRWGLAKLHMEEIEQLIEQYRCGEISLAKLRETLRSKFMDWGVIPLPPLDILDIELFYTVKAVVSTVNIALILILLFIYIDIYYKTKARFTIGLIIFSLILFFYTVSSNPFIQMLFGFRAFGLGPFAMLPDVFTFIALTVLLYLSLK